MFKDTDELKGHTFDNPAVFVLRKIDASMPLVKGEGRGIRLSPDSANHEINLIDEQLLYRALGEKYKEYRMAGIRMSWIKDPKDISKGVITIKCKHEGDSVLINDQILYEAPEDGYDGEATIYMPTINSFQQRYYLFLKTATPITYSRIDMNIQVRDGQSMRVDFDAFINPYGNRVLEQSPSDSLYGGLATYPFTREAIKALACGKNPLLPTEDELLKSKERWEKKLAEDERIRDEQIKMNNEKARRNKQ
jgi:hypothetical protein